MLLRSPKNLHYPITVTELLIYPNDNVERSAALFSYFYKSTVTEGNQYGEEFQVEKTFPTRFESEAEGTLTAWKIAAGSIIEGPDTDLVEIEEPCRHDVQFGGMCANCGKDMTEADYNTSKPDTTRAVINMSHGNTALRVSKEEAARVEQEAKRRLLKSRKLSLVVDLDQTIIHATVDPTVAEWQRDETNPNHEAVSDVRSFQLLDEGPGRGCWYYIKLRPGLADFLENISKLYELHIYTMGTRAYALNIAKIVDPERKIFGDRILSRDESGSLVAKNLQRLFPVDTKMVVIIDDRGDVWSWSDNLIKVKAYDFFVGIGDINSSFLPKREELIPASDKPALLLQPPPETQTENTLINPPDLETASVSALLPPVNGTSRSVLSGETSTLDQLVSMGGSNDAASIKEKTTQQDEAIAAQLTDRPLLQMQKALDKYEEDAVEQAAIREQNGESIDEAITNGPRPRHNLLKDDDEELVYLENALTEVHRLFYDAYEKTLAGVKGGRIAQLRGEKSPKKRPDEELHVVPDVKDILPSMKRKVLEHVVLTFSGVVPLGTYARNSDLGRWATSFGASINTDVHKNTTHVIASRNRRTAKVRVAARNPRIKIVTTMWLLDSISRWKALQENPYIIDVEPDREHASVANSTSPLDDLVDGTLSSSEEDAGPADEELEKLRKSLHIDTLVGDLANEATDQHTRSPAEEFTDEITDENWQAWQDEIDAASDDGDSTDTDDDGSASDASQGSQRSNKKRKRGIASGNVTDADESDVSVKGEGSLLQVRKKRALERTTSLTQVATLKPPNGPSSKGVSQVLHNHGNGNGTERNGFKWQPGNADNEDVEAGSKAKDHGDREAQRIVNDQHETVGDSKEPEPDDEEDDGFDIEFAAELDAQFSAESGNDDEP